MGSSPTRATMDKIVIFKDMMHEPMLIEGSGSSEKLSEILGERNVERLITLGVIKAKSGQFEVTETGKKMIEIFNRK